MSGVETTLIERLEALAGETQRQIAQAPAVVDVEPAEKMVEDLRHCAAVLTDTRMLLDVLTKHGDMDPAAKAYVDQIIERLDEAEREPVLGEPKV